MKLTDTLPYTYTYHETDILIDLSFDTVLEALEVARNEQFRDFERVGLCLALLFEEDTIADEDAVAVWNEVYGMYLYAKSDEFVEYDELGEPMPQKKQKRLLDLQKDAEYIYASFMQSYQINLFQEQTQMHWWEFKALLNGLPQDTILKQIMGYRGYEPSPGDSAEYKNHMLRMQEMFSLEEDDDEEEVE